MRGTSHRGAVRIVTGVVFLLVGVFLLGKALLPARTESQALVLADTVFGTGGGLKVMATYPSQVIMGKSSQVKLEFEPAALQNPENLVFDRQLEAPGYVVIPQKRIISPLKEGRASNSWQITTFQAGRSQAQILLSLGGLGTSGQFAITPGAQIDFELNTITLLGMDSSQLITTGIILTLAGLLVVVAELRGRRKNL